MAAGLGVGIATELLLDSLIAALAGILGPLAVPRRQREVGVPRDAWVDLARLGMSDWFARAGPRPRCEQAEVRCLLDHAW